MTRKNQPNLVYIFTDQQRADTMSAYGNNWIQTPNLNRLSDDSIVFENAYVSAPICTPSRATQMTGLWPHTNGCTKNNIPLADDIKTFAEFFTDDYHTAYYGKWHLGDEVIKRRGWDEWHSIEDQYRVWSTKEDNNEILSDYHHYLISQGYKPDKESSGKMVFSRSFAAQLPEEHTKAAYLGRKVSEFIDHNKANPFAICVNFFEPHPPYTGPFDDLYEPDDIPQTPVFRVDPPDNASRMSTLMADDQAKKRLVINQDQETSILENDDEFNGPKTNSEKEFRRVQAKYYGLVTLMDKAVGQILDAIENAGISEETIVVFTSEHGDQMGDHNFFHKIVMYEQSTKVPTVSYTHLTLPTNREV